MPITARPHVSAFAPHSIAPTSATLQRVPAGHPEGYLEAFANLYRAFARAIQGKDDIERSFPGVQDGLRGMRFLRAVLESSKKAAWVKM